MPCVCRAAYLDESDAQGTSNALDASRKLSVLSRREYTARHVQIPRAQGECQLNRLQGLAPACKARDLVRTPAHLVVLRIRLPKIPRRLLPLRVLPHLHPGLWTANCPPLCGTRILSGWAGGSEASNGSEGCPVEPERLAPSDGGGELRLHPQGFYGVVPAVQQCGREAMVSLKPSAVLRKA